MRGDCREPGERTSSGGNSALWLQGPGGSHTLPEEVPVTHYAASWLPHRLCPGSCKVGGKERQGADSRRVRLGGLVSPEVAVPGPIRSWATPGLWDDSPLPAGEPLAGQGVEPHVPRSRF